MTTEKVEMKPAVLVVDASKPQTALEVHPCQFCGHALANGWSIGVHIGPVCRAKMGLEPVKKVDREVERCSECNRPMAALATRKRGMGTRCAMRKAKREWLTTVLRPVVDAPRIVNLAKTEIGAKVVVLDPDFDFDLAAPRADNVLLLAKQPDGTYDFLEDAVAEEVADA